MNNERNFGKTIIEVIEVKRNKFTTFIREKAFLILLLMSIFAVAGIVAVNMAKEEKDTAPKLLAELENETTTRTEKETRQQAEKETTARTEKETEQVAMEETNPGDALLAEGEPDSVADITNLMDATDEPDWENLAEGIPDPEDDPAEAVDVTPMQLSFYENSKLSWPVEGNVILDFSMDATVFFNTLQQYKYNPAILIQGEVNTPVLAAADGVVTEISSNEEIGDYVTMALGNDYSLQYGQLKALEVSMGEEVRAGDIIGYISEPSKYYVTEGSHLYLKLMNGETPVDPLDYIQ